MTTKQFRVIITIEAEELGVAQQVRNEIKAIIESNEPAADAVVSVGSVLIVDPKMEQPDKAQVPWQDGLSLLINDAQASWLMNPHLNVLAALNADWFDKHGTVPDFEIEKKPENPACPRCASTDIDRCHSASNCVGECDYWSCGQCGHDWGHG